MNNLKLSAVFLLLLTGCDGSITSSSNIETAPPAKIQITDDALAVAKDGNQFAADLYARLSSPLKKGIDPLGVSAFRGHHDTLQRDNPLFQRTFSANHSTNLFFSPYSLSVALAMTYAGADGQTKSEMANVLHFAKQDSELHSAMNSLRQNLVSSDTTSGVELRIANRLWGQLGFPFLPEFRQVTSADYGAEMARLDFNQPEQARESINSWIEKQTDRKIENLIVPGVIDSKTRLVLTNAIYFKGHWKDQFDKRLTKNLQFHVSASEAVDVPMMQMTDEFRYAEVEDVQVLELPYGKAGNTSMFVLLPKPEDGLDPLEAQLARGEIDKWTSGLKPTRLGVFLPRFKMTSEFILNEVLTSMGMPLAFSINADFSRMCKQKGLFISAVIHKAFVDVNEEGTEAAAATGVFVKTSFPIQFRADHPFVFLIRDNRTQTILFLGRVMNPKS